MSVVNDEDRVGQEDFGKAKEHYGGLLELCGVVYVTWPFGYRMVLWNSVVVELIGDE